MSEKGLHSRHVANGMQFNEIQHVGGATCANSEINGRTVPWYFCLEVADINYCPQIIPRYPHDILTYKSGDWQKVKEGDIEIFRVNKWAFLNCYVVTDLI